MSTFRIRTCDTDHINKFFQTCKTDYTDIIISGEVALFIGNTSSVFSVLKMSGEKSFDFKNTSFRINTSLLKNTINNGFIEFSIIDDSITVSILNERKSLALLYSIKKCVVYNDGYSDKLHIIRDLHKHSVINISEILDVRKITGVTDCIINVSNGICSVLNTDVRVYKSVDITDNFAVLSSTLKVLGSVSRNVFNVGKYLIASDNKLCTLATKCRLMSDMEYNEIMEAKSALRCEINIGDLFETLKSLDVKDDIYFDFDNKLAQVSVNGVDVKIPLNVDKIEKSDKYSIRVEKIPCSVLLRITQRETDIISFSKKRYFNIIEIGDTNIVFRS